MDKLTSASKIMGERSRGGETRPGLSKKAPERQQETIALCAKGAEVWSASASAMPYKKAGNRKRWDEATENQWTVADTTITGAKCRMRGVAKVSRVLGWDRRGVHQRLVFSRLASKRPGRKGLGYNNLEA